MLDISRRQLVTSGAASAAFYLATKAPARGLWLPQNAVDVRDFILASASTHDEAFRAALAASTTVMVPKGNYSFNSPISLRSGSQLIGSGRPMMHKLGSPYAPLLFAERTTGVKLSGLHLIGGPQLEVRVPVRYGQRSFVMPFELGDPPTFAIKIEGADPQPLQPGIDFKLVRDVVQIAVHVDMTRANSLLFWREQAHSPLVQFWETRESLMNDLSCENGALWVGGAGDRALAVVIEGCKIANGQIRVHGVGNEVTPSRIGMRRTVPDGPQDVRIERNTLVGRIALGEAKHYLRFGERAAGIEIQGFARNIRILRNSVSGQAGDGIWLASSADTLVEENHVYSNGLSGIGLETGTVLPSLRCTLRGNIVTDNWFDGCDFNFSTGPADSEVVIEDNVFSGNGFDIGQLHGGCGIFINKVRNAQIARNQCENNNIAGIWCEGSGTIGIESNRCFGNGRTHSEAFASCTGIAISNSHNVMLQGNIAGGSGALRQRADIAFKFATDRAGASTEKNVTASAAPAKITIWNGRDYVTALQQ